MARRDTARRAHPLATGQRRLGPFFLSGGAAVANGQQALGCGPLPARPRVREGGTDAPPPPSAEREGGERLHSGRLVPSGSGPRCAGQRSSALAGRWSKNRLTWFGLLGIVGNSNSNSNTAQMNSSWQLESRWMVEKLLRGSDCCRRLYEARDMNVLSVSC